MERVSIIIDGSNFYHRLKESDLKKHLLAFRYDLFASFLLSGRIGAWKRYYIGAIREERGNPKSHSLMIDQQKLIGRLTRDKWEIQFGHMLKTDGYHEKGVDVLMSVDMLVGAYENQYDTLALVSSDTDLIPALAKIRSMNKRVEYIGFSSLPSYGLIKHSDIRRLLTQGDLERFFTDK